MTLENDLSIKGEDPYGLSFTLHSVPVGEQAGRTGEATSFGLSMTQPVPGVAVVWVVGELDMITCPLLDRYLETQLAARPAHLVVDLEAVEFMGCTGLNTLITVREQAQAVGSVLYLTGMKTRAVLRPLELTGLLSLFQSYLTLTDAPSELTSKNPVNQARCTSPSPITPDPGWMSEAESSRIGERLGGEYVGTASSVPDPAHVALRALTPSMDGILDG